MWYRIEFFTALWRTSYKWLMLTRRQATDDDIAFLEVVFLRAMRVPITAARGLWDEARERAQFREQLQLNHTQIIENNGIGVGFLMTLERGHDIQVHTICIGPENQRHGFGTAIIRELLDDASARERGVIVSVLKANPAARSLYERLGFVVTEESTHHHHMRLVS
jgi:ribosomal protein S18 acetylase RimI-like enzyme